MEVFKQLRVNIPFVEALSKMPKYAKYLKEILTSKKKLEYCVSLKEECSVILSRQLPPKLKDPGSFTIPCSIGGMRSTALCDLGASINLMPYAAFKRMGMEGLKPTSISLQLADRSITNPRGIVENVLVQVDNFLYPVDFVVMDMEEGDDFALILGRPFLATAKAVIDVPKGKLTFKFDDKELVVNSYNFKNSSFFQKNFHAANIFSSSPLQESKIGDPLGGLTNLFDNGLKEPRRMVQDVMMEEAEMPGKVKKKERKHPPDMENGYIPIGAHQASLYGPEMALKKGKGVASHAILKPP